MTECIVNICIILLIAFIVTITVCCFKAEERIGWLTLVKFMVYFIVAFLTLKEYIVKNVYTELSSQLSGAIFLVSITEMMTNGAELYKMHKSNKEKQKKLTK